MNTRKKVLLSIGIVIAVLGFICWSWMIAFTDWGLTDQDREFVAKIQEKLAGPNTKVKVADVFPGNWDFVCFISEYEKTSRTLARQADINPEDLHYEIGHNLFGTDGVWGIVFFEKPDKAYVFSIASNYYFPYSGGCEKKQDAYLEKASDPLSKEFTGLKLKSN